MRFVKYYAGNVAAVGAAGRAFYLIGDSSATQLLPRFACQTTIAAQFVRRKPCGQHIVKPAYSCLKFKTQNHVRLALLATLKIHRRRIPTKIRHR
ncbi:MAG: hypothetical protein NT159_24610 [Proteobacteria bacterium]|nr:hypothetical protein [Pseudomonadota bacterium]